MSIGGAECPFEGSLEVRASLVKARTSLSYVIDTCLVARFWKARNEGKAGLCGMPACYVEPWPV